jgi:hypothetical protein
MSRHTQRTATGEAGMVRARNSATVSAKFAEQIFTQHSTFTWGGFHWSG